MFVMLETSYIIWNLWREIKNDLVEGKDPTEKYFLLEKWMEIYEQKYDAVLALD